MGPVPPEFLDHIIAGGPAAIFAVMWWLERQDRIKAQAMINSLGERAYTALEAAKNTLDGFKALLGAQTKR